MPAGLSSYLEANTNWLVWLSASSAAMLVGSLLLVPWLVLKAPEDVFVRHVRLHRSAGAVIGALLRNVFGACLFAAGVLMLVLPGQGMLTIVVALCLVDLPRKRALFRRLVARPRIWKTLRWIRKRGGRPPFIHP
jgi:hypothetical protein